MSRSHVCIGLIFDLSGRLIEIVLTDDCKFFTSVPGRKKFLVAPVSSIASLYVIFIINVDYSVSLDLGFQLLMLVIFHHLHSLCMWLVVQIYCRYFLGGVQRVYRIRF